MNGRYIPENIEGKWQKKWEEQGAFRHYDRERKFYTLDMFPYPSGAGLHVGHPKGYIATDVLARKKQLEGYAVLHPMGWDAFGLPAEQYAIKTKTHPRVATEKNVATFKRQLESLGFTYDWDREINTTDPEYFKWTQWIFLQMFKKGLAYESYEPIIWCPSCQTGLANEDLENGACERCGTIVEKKPMRQWVLRITDYADRLLEGLDGLDWPESIKESQRNWIGRSEGTIVKFRILNFEFRNGNGSEGDRIAASKTSRNDTQYIEVFTTRVDTLFGCTYVVVAPEHPLLKNQESRIKNQAEVEAYLEETRKKTEMERTAEGREKTGVRLEGVMAVNPINGEEVPVFVADYVLGDYGTGAVMAVPAHDTRDFAFAEKLGLPVKYVIHPSAFSYQKADGTFQTVEDVHPENDTNTNKWLSKRMEEIGNSYTSEGKLINSGIYTGVHSLEAREKITAKLESEGLGKKVVKYKLREWVFSRQRYWGEPIPVVHCESCAVNEADAKLTLNFREENVWKRILSGEKTVETRALNPDEPERFFGDVTEGDMLRFVFKPTDEAKLFKVKTVYRFGDIRELFESEQKDLHGKIFGCGFSTAEELEESYAALSPDYAKRIRENGLVGWEIEPVHVSKVVPVPESELPVRLPDVESYEPTGTGESPLAGIDEWVNTTCPACGGPAKRETNTMPQWAGSSWYYLRYIDPKNAAALVGKEQEKKWMPVDAYVGGAEHATRHLIYARFWHKFLFDIGAVSTDEPFRKLVNVGLILASDGRKMSKRWGNVVNPDDVVGEFGADAMRLYEMFMGPFSQMISWNTDGVVGTRRFLDKTWKLREKISADAGSAKAVDPLLHKTIAKVTEDIDAFRFNTAVSSLMELVNAFGKEETISHEQYGIFLILLSPFAPHIAEELWEGLGNTESIFLSSWPEADPSLLVSDTMTIVVQVNGKLRDSFEVPADISEDELKKKALASDKVKPYLDGKEPKRVIIVPGKLVNVVV